LRERARVRVKKLKMKIYIHKENKEFKRGETPSYKNHPLNTESGEFKRGETPLKKHYFPIEQGVLRGAQPLLENLSSLSLGRGSG
jgi:hypothetical protein